METERSLVDLRDAQIDTFIFSERVLFLDLEIETSTNGTGDKLIGAGALRGHRQYKLRQSRQPASWAIREMAPFASGAEMLVGHNIVDHDLVHLRRWWSNSPLSRLPVADTLFLSVLAKPQNPYHRLVKDYKLVGGEKNDPVGDCRLTRELLFVCGRLLAQWERSHPGVLSFYRSCFDATSTDLAGTGMMLERWGGESLPPHQLVAAFQSLTSGRVCPNQVSAYLPRLLRRDDLRAAAAYTLAWILVAGTESVLPRWAHHRFPEAERFIHKVRSTPCGQGCSWCAENHDLTKQLKEIFKFHLFRPTPATPSGDSLQEQLATRVMNGVPVLGIMPTGGGKSVCYQLPAIVGNRQTGDLTVVISPLQALMRDQVEGLNRKADAYSFAGTLNGAQTFLERGDTLERIRLGHYALLYVSPEQLRNTSFKRAVRQRRIRCWVFDEAHCISQWGHDFRPDYLYAARFIREFSKEEGVARAPVACFTATAKQDVIEDIQRYFKKELYQELKVVSSASINRPELSYTVEECPAERKETRIHELLSKALRPPGDKHSGSAIVYAATRSRTEKIAAYLQEKNWEADYFHAGRESPDKTRVQRSFLAGETPVIVATNAFGMGIDKPDVRIVIHADIPGSIESYLQEAGRAGRDGNPADCVLLYNQEDLERQFWLGSQNEIKMRDIAQILRAIRSCRRPGTEEVVVSPGELLRSAENVFIGREQDAHTRVKVAISWLERAGFVVRDENLTKLFQGAPAVQNRKAAERTMDRLDLKRSVRQRWTETLEMFRSADKREGIEIDRVAALPSYRKVLQRLEAKHQGHQAKINEEIARVIFRNLYEMSRVGLLKRGAHFSAWVRHKIASNAALRLHELGEAQATLLRWFRENHPNGGFVRVPINTLQRVLRQQDVGMLRSDLVNLLGGWEARNPDPRQTVRTKVAGGMLEARLESWEDAKHQLRQRQAVARNIIKHMGGLIESRGQGRGEKLVLFSLEDLAKEASGGQLELDGRIPDPIGAVEKTLLFLDEHRVIRLQHGLSMFRQAMNLALPAAARGRRYTKGHYRDLEGHYREKVFQVHAIGRYAVERIGGAETDEYLSRYFDLPTRSFKERYFPDRRQLGRATSQDTYQRIVSDLNPTQEAIVTAPKEKNLLVLAGPGSGKTKVVAHRCAYLLQVENIHPSRILVVCFNRSAMHELRKRLELLVGQRMARRVAVHTYHSLALRLTNTSAADILKDDPDRGFDQMVEDANRLLEGKERVLGVEKDEVRDHLLSGYEFVLVDEYQDINDSQYQMLSHIARKAGRETDSDRYAAAMAVGDDDQSIYQFRGANTRHIRRFKKDFNAEPHYMVENYRSTKNIIQASNMIIRKNSDRIKGDYPIRIDSARETDPPGDRWEGIDARRSHGRVLVAKVDNSSEAAIQALAEIERTRRADPDQAQDGDFAVLARTWEQADLARMALLHGGIRVREVLKSGFPLERVREFDRLLTHINHHSEVDVHQLGKTLEDVCGENSLWTATAARMIFNLADEFGQGKMASPHVTDALSLELGAMRKSRVVGDGVLVSTAHSAKGMEFPHVIILGGDWKPGRCAEREDERRLFYVAMTRAMETLTIINPADDPLPYVGDLQDAERRTSQPLGTSPAETRRVLGMEDMFLSWAGLQDPHHPVHQALAETSTHQGVELKAGPKRLSVCHKDGGAKIGEMSEVATNIWLPRLEQIAQVRVFALLKRLASEGDGRFQHKVESWEVPILEITYAERQG